ncbi:MAG: hypothetical protein D6760_12940 [Deltaproteobacteria bacterium]|nr:MAG: hypothetical protein D6760_12940 [Deltaproteobacteria bacterium]
MERVEKKLQDLLSQVTHTVGADRVANVLGGAMVGAARTKATIDRNIDALMAMANLPTRSDYQRLQTKLDSLQGSIVNLTRAVEQLRTVVADGRGTRGKAARATTKKKSSRTKTAASGRTRSSAKSRGGKRS